MGKLKLSTQHMRRVGTETRHEEKDLWSETRHEEKDLW